MTITTDSNNNYAEFGTFKRTSSSSKSSHGKDSVLFTLNKLEEFYDIMGLEFDEIVFNKVLND